MPTKSPLEAEACSLLMAVQEVWKLRYKYVAFMTDCKQLRDELHQQMAEQTIFNVPNTEASSMIRVIVAMAMKFSFTFHCVPRTLTRNVDVMAKEARQGQKTYASRSPHCRPTCTSYKILFIFCFATFNITTIWLRSDCKGLIQAITTNHRSVELFGVLADIESIISTAFLSFHASFLPRSQNGPADSFAKTSVLGLGPH
ncbi:hypothetical protein IGI04_032288 [Brassica rapa subsp. trilocularis]|uniref:RNase H type-1 domain-containing protein n=1 Tax=Brassica rapa subsp. trilocularis TaxID=1813537 RepID=A0ABQ7LWV0_BRACM|nr:hypothetical protein IGI04_032288 [Brassica rapa subsp. trilocularis]